ncbi:MAG: site-2 protease family protein [Betaproteobacteria bacterium]
MEFSLVETVLLYAIPVIFAITLHEAAHGYVARMFGDSTAYMLGRVTLNPIKHIDPIGTIAVPLGLLLISKLAGGGGLLFGWAKPVPVNFANLRNPKSDMFWVAAAGPGANLLMALIWATLLKFGGSLDQPGFFATMAIQGITINVVLMVLNLLPIPPLDGGRIMVSVLPHALAYRFAQLERFGFMLIILLMATGALNLVMGPLVRASLHIITTVFGF